MGLFGGMDGLQDMGVVEGDGAVGSGSFGMAVIGFGDGGGKAGHLMSGLAGHVGKWFVKCSCGWVLVGTVLVWGLYPLPHCLALCWLL